MVYRGSLFFTFSLFYISCIGLLGDKQFCVAPDSLEILVDYRNGQIVKGEFDCHSVELTYWETWPLAGIAIIGGSYSAPADSFSRRNRN